MRKDHRPYWLRNAYSGFEAWYARHFLLPAFDTTGEAVAVARPWNVHVFGPRVHLGHHVEIRATASDPVRFTTWCNPTDEDPAGHGTIEIGDCALIGPGSRIQSAHHITLGPDVMLATQVLITDADWHGLYDRTSAPGKTSPVHIGENAWIGDGAKLLKGCRVGCNSIIGAGSVVTGSIGDNLIAAGNPARVIGELDSTEPFVTRRSLYEGERSLAAATDALYRLTLKDNTTWGWLRSRLFPARSD